MRIGIYANAINVWHWPYEFALDWALTEAPEIVDEDDPASPIRIPASVVARVRIPATLVFDVMRALNKTRTATRRSMARSNDPSKKTNPISSVTRRDIPVMVDPRFRYRSEPWPNATTYTTYLPRESGQQS